MRGRPTWGAAPWRSTPYFRLTGGNRVAIAAADVPAETHLHSQAFVERIHASWPIGRDYMAPPSRGESVALDPALLVVPSKGMEVGYDPIGKEDRPRIRSACGDPSKIYASF